jgi:hypothetical protein
MINFPQRSWTAQAASPKLRVVIRMNWLFHIIFTAKREGNSGTGVRPIPLLDALIIRRIYVEIWFNMRKEHAAEQRRGN